MNKSISLLPYDIVRPEKVLWTIPYKGGDVLDILKSKTTRSFLRRSEQNLQDYGITWKHEVMSKESYLQWLEYYEQRMSEQEFDVIATPEWYDQKLAEGKTVEAILFYQGEQLVGSEVFLTIGKEKVSAAFKASARIEGLSKKRQSLGAILDYYLLKNVTERGFTTITFGRSRNAFGVINGLGYLDYKLRWCTPVPSDDVQMLDEVPVNEEGYVLFFGLQEGKLALYALKPKELEMEFEHKRFATEELPFIELEY